MINNQQNNLGSSYIMKTKFYLFANDFINKNLGLR
jgi:hypothetical protein